LTNFSINKKNTKFIKNNDSGQKSGTADKNHAHGDDSDNKSDEGPLDAESSKWDFKMLKAAYDKMGANYGQMFNGMKDIILKTLLTVEPTI